MAYTPYLEEDEDYLLSDDDTSLVSSDDEDYLLSDDDTSLVSSDDSDYLLSDDGSEYKGYSSISPWELSKQNLKSSYANIGKYAEAMGITFPEAYSDWSKAAGPESQRAQQGYRSEYEQYNNDITQVPWSKVPGFLSEKVQENGYLMSLQASGGWLAGKLLQAPNPYLKSAGVLLAAATFAAPAPMLIDESIQTHAKELGIPVDQMTTEQLNNGTITGLENLIAEGLLPSRFMGGAKLPKIKDSKQLFKHLTTTERDTFLKQLREGSKYMGQSMLIEGGSELGETANIYRTSVSGISGLDRGEAATSFFVGTAAGGPMSTPSSISQGRAYNKFRKQGEQYLNATDRQTLLESGGEYKQIYQKLRDSYVGPATKSGEVSIDEDAIDFTPKQYNLPKQDPGKLSLLGKGLGKIGINRSTNIFEDMFSKAKTAKDAALIRNNLFGRFGEVESGSGETGYGASFNTKRHLNVGNATREFNRIHRKWGTSVGGMGDYFSNVPQVIDNYVGALLENKNVSKYRAELLDSRWSSKIGEIEADTKVLKGELKNTLGMLRASNLSVGEQENYKPRAYDRKSIKKDKEGFIKSLKEDVGIETNEEAEKIYYSFLDGKDPEIMTSEQIRGQGTQGKGQGKRGFEKRRTHRFDKLNNKFLEPSTFGGLQDYFINAATRAASAEAFGDKGKGLHKDVNEALKRGLMTPDQADTVWKMYDAEHHLYNRPSSPEGEVAHQAMKVATTAAAITYLGLAPISSITEPAWISGRVGLANMLKATPTVAAHMLKGLKRTIYAGGVGKEAGLSFGRRLINALGMATNPRESERMMKMFAGDKNNFLNAYFRGPAGLFLTQYTNLVRVWTATAGLKMIQSHANKINTMKGHKLAGWKNELKENGMSVNDFKQMVRLGNGKIDIMNDEYLDTRFTKDDGTNVSIRDLLHPWLRKITTDVALEPGVGNRPLWMSDPNLQLISQLKSFPILFGNTIMKRTMRQINPKVCTPGIVGAVGAIGSAATAMALAAMALAIKDEIKGLDKDRGVTDVVAGIGVPYLGTDSLGQLFSIPAASVVDNFWSAATGEEGSVPEEAFDLFLRATVGAIFAEQLDDE
jgi:hypothetical protein